MLQLMERDQLKGRLRSWGAIQVVWIWLLYAFVTSWKYLQVSRCSCLLGKSWASLQHWNAVGTFLFIHFDASISPAPWHGHAAMPPCPFEHIQTRGAGLIREGPCERCCIQYHVTFQSWVTSGHKRTDMKWFQRNPKPAICIFRILRQVLQVPTSGPSSMVQLHDPCHATPQAPLFRESRSQTALPSHSPNPTGTSMWPLLSVGRCWITHVANVGRS